MKTKDELIALRRDLDAKKSHFQALGFTNVAGRTAEDRVEIDLEYERARGAYEAAQSLYDAAIRESQG